MNKVKVGTPIKYKGKEIWKDIEGYEGLYQVSTYGRVKSLKRTHTRKDGKKFLVKEKYLMPQTGNHGYLVVVLCNGEKKMVSIHRIIAKAFIPNPENKPQVNHINEIRNDNRIDNLEWATARENVSYSKKRIKYSSKHIGVSWNQKNNSWISTIHIDKQSRYLGSFKNELKASEAYQTALYNWESKNQLPCRK